MESLYVVLCQSVQLNRIDAAAIVEGYKVMSRVVEGIERWMEKKGFQEINEFVGLALKRILPLEELERRKICHIVVDDSKCTGCGICVEVCLYDALEIGRKVRLVVDSELCDNCGLCVSICPFEAPSLEKQGKQIREDNLRSAIQDCS